MSVLKKEVGILKCVKGVRDCDLTLKSPRSRRKTDCICTDATDLRHSNRDRKADIASPAPDYSRVVLDKKCVAEPLEDVHSVLHEFPITFSNKVVLMTALRLVVNNFHVVDDVYHDLLFIHSGQQSE